jgi:hypothetical protein
VVAGAANPAAGTNKPARKQVSMITWNLSISCFEHKKQAMAKSFPFAMFKARFLDLTRQDLPWSRTLID